MPILAAEPDRYPADALDRLPDGTSQSRWWVLHAKPRQEKSLARFLHAAGLYYYLPLLARRHRVRGRNMTAQVPLFTGYVFLWGDPEQRIIALSSNRIVQTLITPDSTRLTRDLRQIDTLLASGAAITPEPRLMPGDVVEISSGPLSGLTGTIVRTATARRFVVTVDFIQQGASVLLDDHNLSPVRDGALTLDERPMPQQHGGSDFAMALIWFFIAFFTLAMIVSLGITPIVRSAALRFGLVDEPDGRRKLHAKPIPVAGGVAVLITSVIMITALFVFADPIKSILKSEIARASFDSVVTMRPELIGLAIAAAIIGLVGVADDLVGLRGGHKILGQMLAVSVVIFTGVKFDTINVFGWTIDLGVMTIPITVFWLLGAINALNLIDGLDGMLGSIGCIVCGSFAALAYLSGQIQAAFVATAVAGSLLGFLFFNFPPATIFLGDCGSMLVGLVVGVLGIESSLKGAAAASLAAPAALLVIPIFDTSAAIIRRWLTGRSIYSTDRAHLHHRLIDSGFSNRQVLLLVGLICLLASAGRSRVRR